MFITVPSQGGHTCEVIGSLTGNSSKAPVDNNHFCACSVLSPLRTVACSANRHPLDRFLTGNFDESEDVPFQVVGMVDRCERLGRAARGMRDTHNGDHR